MTVKYNHLIAEATLLGFPKLLFRWKGSLWKLVWIDMIFFGSIYLFISLMYLYVLDDIQRERFQEVAIYCNLNSFKIPLGFLLGFYVQQVMDRFWLSFKTIPWPTDIAFYINLFITGEGEDSRLFRRTIIRYICCSFVLTMRSICKPVKKRFPSFAHLVDAGLMTPEEVRDIGALNIKFNNYFVPIAWSTKLVGDARKDGLIRRDMDYDRLTRELNEFRSKCATLLKFDWISLPLVYTQVVSIALYLFCFTCLLGRYPFIKGEASEARFPFFTMAQFIFYMSWLKVGESVANPFGEDDDDFDINTLIDNFVNESYLIVDRLKTNVPDLKKDKHWDINVALKKLLLNNVEYMGSAAGLLISEEKQAVREIEKAEQKL